ncbi:copper oxidase [Hypericibacter adhaerens]|uniref:Copper oxidase n=1 Tax=Hypericibacter adhaerens TaxID=2602016 RepID=A0A5J6MW06_9PROT|nr:multicopper oxidase family protein [Hypericibacter adhaerens]QEX21277.1 copper oxidase [Hypericibacter adhaerens]
MTRRFSDRTGRGGARNLASLSRRHFLQGTALLAAGAAFAPPLARAAAGDPVALRVTTRQLDIAGRSATVFGLQQPDGRPGLIARVGEDFAVRLENGLTDPTLVHWHGLTPPWREDGVPGISQDPLAPGAAQDYRFPLTRSGTFWMHSHLGLQEQQLLAAPLIVQEASPQDEQEVVLLLHDFSFRAPEEILAGLQAGTRGGPGMSMSGDGAWTMDHSSMDHGSMPGMSMDGGAMGSMTMSGGMTMDINDIEHDAYLANDRTLDDPELVAVERGGRVRLRIINGAASTGFTIDLGAVEGELIAVDGHAILPVKGRRFPIAIAQRLDIRLSLPADGSAVPVLALREGALQRAGVILQPPGAAVARIAPVGDVAAPVLDLAFERTLRSAAPLTPRPADRALTLALTGSMAGYRWGLAASSGAGPLTARDGERIEVALVNQTMMAHPMHLHGHMFQVVAIDGERLAGAVRDTVLVPPGRSVGIAFDADNPGRWAFHCHHMYHMAAGMMTTLAYEGIT